MIFCSLVTISPAYMLKPPFFRTPGCQSSVRKNEDEKKTNRDLVGRIWRQFRPSIQSLPRMLMGSQQHTTGFQSHWKIHILATETADPSHRLIHPTGFLGACWAPLVWWICNTCPLFFLRLFWAAVCPGFLFPGDVLPVQVVGRSAAFFD